MKRYKEARGMGGFVRSNWDEVSELIASSLLHTVQKYGCDRIFGFSVIPAKSMLSYAAGLRFVQLMGGAGLSFYDWYADLPLASPQVWGDQTDVRESSDWYNAGYIITWGSNVPQTRTPDAHFLTEVRYKGTKVVSIAPDYAESTAVADTWISLKTGSDSALAMAFGGHVTGILIPKSLTGGVGINEHLYHIIALGGGIPAGILSCLGFFLLMRRRFDNPRMKVNTSTSDGVIYFVLFLTLITGFGGTLLNAIGLLGDEFNYRETISVWFRSVLVMNPDVSLMADTPIIFKAHLILAMLTMMLFPFTRLVHCLSFPFEYFMRSSIIYRRK